VCNNSGVADQAAVRKATRAVYIAFAGGGFAYASWASRIPQVRAELRVTPGTLGLILLCGAIGSGTATQSVPLRHRGSGLGSRCLARDRGTGAGA